MTRRWTQDTEFELDGLRWRVVKGRKAPEDLRLEHMTPNGRWRPTAMALLFMLVDFWYENEDLLYPKPKFQGADYLLRALGRAAHNGYPSEVERLEGEKRRKREREAPKVALPLMPLCGSGFEECDGDAEWHCPVCRRHLESVYLPCPDHLAESA